LGDAVGRLGELAAREDVARLELDELGELLLPTEQLAAEAHLGDAKLLALVDVDGDLDALLVGRDRHLRRLDRELEIAAIEIERAQCFEVARELLARILVVLRIPGEPAGRGQPHLVEQLLLAVCPASDEADRRDARVRALLDRERDADAIALERRNRRRDLYAVLAAREVLALELLLGALEHGAIEDARLGQALVAQRLAQRVAIELLRSGDVDRRDRGALLDVHDEDVAFGPEPHGSIAPHVDLTHDSASTL